MASERTKMLVELLRTLSQGGAQDEADIRIHTLIIDIAQEVDELKERVEKLESAFPQKDPVGHFNYHERRMKELRSNAEASKDTRKEIYKVVSVGVLLWVLQALFSYAKSQMMGRP